MRIGSCLLQINKEKVNSEKFQYLNAGGILASMCQNCRAKVLIVHTAHQMLSHCTVSLIIKLYKTWPPLEFQMHWFGMLASAFETTQMTSDTW